jgi:transcriptional regulator with XRE-family HTH domain
MSVIRYNIAIRQGGNAVDIRELLAEKKITKYRLSKISGVPHTTVADIFSGKAKIENCSAGIVYKLAKALDVPMETLLEDAMEFRSDFETFKSNVCHRVKEMGDIDFIIETVKSDIIRTLFKRKWYPESLYLLAMVDYLCRENEMRLCASYNDIRQMRLAEPLFPLGIITLTLAQKSDEPKERSLKEAIPEFMRFNIVESEVRNVV